jgi:flagellar assembly protein FliH
LSNIIKSSHVFLNQDNTKVINSDDKLNQLFLFLNQNNGINGEIAATKEEGFQEGLNALVIDQSKEEYNEKFQDELNRQKDELLENAHKEAELIIAKALEDSKRTSEYLYEEAQKNGYEAGMLKARAELEARKKQYEELENRLKLDYSELIAKLEPEFCDVLIALLKKLTGVIIEEKRDIILYLIHNAISQADNCKNYIIKTSKEDYAFVLSKKDELLEVITGESVSIDIIADKDLDKNQCLIETESSVIDCSLDVQLKGMIQDLKLLSIQTDNFEFMI